MRCKESVLFPYKSAYLQPSCRRIRRVPTPNIAYSSPRSYDSSNFSIQVSKSIEFELGHLSTMLYGTRRRPNMVHKTELNPYLVIKSLFPSLTSRPGPTQLEITTRNQQSSPLLSLPGEIRNKIWDFVLSSTSIHVVWHTDHGYGTRRCICCIPPGNKEYGSICPYSPIPPIRPLRTTSHAGQTTAPKPHCGILAISPIRFQFLQTSRQIQYETSSLIFWQSTFHFDNPYIFNQFSGGLSLAEKALMRNLRLTILAWGFDHHDRGHRYICLRERMVSWGDALEPSVLAQLSGLQSLKIQIMSKPEHREFLFQDLLTPNKTINQRYSHSLLRFRALGVREVRVKVLSDFHWVWDAERGVWTGSEIDESDAADDLQAKILGRKELAEEERIEEGHWEESQGILDGLKNVTMGD